MERWAANTLRTLGIVFTVGATLIASLLLLLLSICAGQVGGSTRESAAFPLFIGTVVTLVVGILITVSLARGIANSAAAALATPRYVREPTFIPSAVPPPSATAPRESFTQPLRPPVVPPSSATASRESFTQPLRLSPLGQTAVNRLIWALGAQIVVSVVCWFVSQLYFWTMPRTLAPHNWILILLVPFVLYRLPYLILIYRFRTQPANRTLIYSFVVPAVLAFQAVFNLAAIIYAYVQHPVGFLLLALPWTIHIVIMVLAWKAIREVGVQPDASYLFRAGVVTFAYFFLLHLASPLFYLLVGR
jgi:hypothetical protein